jgi:hypothetical protein
MLLAFSLLPLTFLYAPTRWRNAVGAWIYCPVRLPKWPVSEEFVIDPAPAPFGGMLDPSPKSVLPMSASAVA